MDNLEVKLESFEHNSCRECGETFNEWTELMNHRENSHSLYTCKTCKKEEISVKDFEYHLQIHGGFRLFKCIICNENFSFLCELNDHLPKHLYEVTDLKKIEYVEVSEAHDEPCSQDIYIKTEDSDNEGNNLDEDVFSETEPGKIGEEERKCSELIEIDQVDKIKRGRPKETDVPRPMLKRRFKCSHCSTTTKTATSLKLHMRSHTGEKPYECADCGRYYLQKCALKIHITMKHDRNKKRTEVCQICGKGFYFVRRLKEHIREIHKKPREKYQRIHTGEKPFSCKKCNKVLSTKNSLKVHMASHGAPIHQCNSCEKSFKIRESLKKHVQRVHEERKFPCFHCGKKYASNGDAIRHMRQTHSKGEKD
ncbi:zinc finger protein 878-like [Phlebotomus papatasi]|uniref:zinc finger protein 878-like n=1 Tax=Phlebotomus papatasi TaxID=29031 RepID=UPI00248463CD|nr:zinc finger protein 878-like [Phlebotomus papatasi]